MIQDIAPHLYKNEYIPLPPDQDSILLCFQKRQVLVRLVERGFVFPTFQELECYSDHLYDSYTYLFQIDRTRFYLGNIIDEKIKGFEWKDIQIFRSIDSKYLSFAGITGWQLYNWYQSHQYCGHCGTLMIQDTRERMLKCPNCHQVEYPKISPAVIIGLTHKDKILMSQYVGRKSNHYALLAGYNEIGETIEETIQREVYEEVGLKVKNITYYKSQPWSFSDTLLFGFFVELDGEDETITLDETELAMAKWFTREEIPETFDDYSLTNEMIMVFKENRKNQ